MKLCSRCKIEQPEYNFRFRYEKRGKYSKQFKYLNNTCRKCDVEIQNKNYFKNKDNSEFISKWREKSRKYYHSNKEKCAEKAKIYRSKNKDKRKAYDKDHAEKISSQHKIAAKRWHEYQRDNVTDVYCVNLIRSQNGGKEKCKSITKEMIEQKRIQILIKRKLYEYQQEINTRRSNDRVDSLF